MLWKLLRHNLQPYRAQVVAVVVLQTITTLATLYLPSLNADIIDQGVARGDTDYIWSTGGIMLGVALVQLATAVTAVWFGAKASMSVGRDLRQAIYTRVDSFSSEEIGKFCAPTLITRSTNDVQQVQMVLLMTLNFMIMVPIMSVGRIVMAVREHPGLSWLVWTSVPILLAILAILIKLLMPLFQRTDKSGALTREMQPAVLADPVEGMIKFAHVAFSYSSDKPLITDLSFKAELGQVVAIVGPTGAGKTTLVNLIMRFYEIQGGQIRLDGIDTARLNRGELRSRIGMVLQDAVLFGGTIMANIRYGRLDASDEEVIEAAKATYVDRFVHTLPDGYETVIEDGGENISAGERQLIIIARAFLAKPALLILDEATSSVDTRTELLVQQAMAALRTDRTSFVIAHRLSTIREADLILVMEDGGIVEQGTHSELLASEGAYYRLYMSQFSEGSDPDAETVSDLPAT